MNSKFSLISASGTLRSFNHASKNHLVLFEAFGISLLDIEVYFARIQKKNSNLVSVFSYFKLLFTSPHNLSIVCSSMFLQ